MSKEDFIALGMSKAQWSMYNAYIMSKELGTYERAYYHFC
jgi:hypothetical protein